MALQDTEYEQQVLVTYAAPQAFLASGSWKQIYASLLAQLPLRNIHWKSSSNPVLRTIQELWFTLVSLDSVRDELTSQIPTTALEKPLLNLYILPCEVSANDIYTYAVSTSVNKDTDLEAYRLVHKKQVKDWLSVVASRKNQDWLLLHLVKHDHRGAGGKLFQLKGSVLEKMKADFNTEKRDRVTQITWSPGSEGNATIWAEVVSKIKDGLIYAFDSAVSQRQEEVKRSESQCQMPGWNFCTFFILKESLSNSFEGMCLFENALLHYDELEETFALVLKEKNLSWFGTLINPHPSDDCLALLSSTKKPYRDLILANNIAVFDLRVYLLARRCAILAKLGRVGEAARKVKDFLVSFARQLRETESTLPRFFIESWIYNSALTAVEQCEQWIATYSVEESQLPSYYGAIGELLELSQIQLNKIGTAMNHLPRIPPITTSSTPEVFTSSTDEISNPDIRPSINDAGKFYELYVDITNRAIEAYTRARRRKFALQLHGHLAALDYHRDRFAAALTTYTSLPAHYASHMWSSLERFSLSRVLDINTKAQQTKNTAWVHSVLAFLKTTIEHLVDDPVPLESGQTEYSSHLIESLRTVSLALDNDVIYLDHPALKTRIAGQARLAESVDGFYLDVEVLNYLPCGMPVDDVTLVLSGKDSGSLVLSSSAKELPAGQSTLTLFSPVSCPGTYILESCQVTIGRLKLQWSHWEKSQKNLHAPPSDVLIQVPLDPQALGVHIRQPAHIELGSSASILVVLSTGRNNTSRIALKLTSEGIIFQFMEATVMEEQVTLTITADGLVFLNLPAGANITIKVPYEGVSTSRSLRVFVDSSYSTTSEPSIMRILRTAHVLSTTLPFSVNVEDFFRGKSLISKYTISATSHQHVRIASISLEAPEKLSNLGVVSCLTRNKMLTLCPAQPIQALFRLDCKDRPACEPLGLVLRYRMLREEVEVLVQGSIDKYLGVLSPQCERLALVKKLLAILENDSTWVELYERTGKLILPPLDDNDESLLKPVRQDLEQNIHQPGPDNSWRVMRIPVDLPQIHVAAAACIRLEVDPELKQPDKKALYAGQPVPAYVTIHTSFHWCVDKRQQYAIRFDVEELVKDWLISGCKRGEFVARDDETFTVPLTMIALHHGIVPLPKVAVAALPIPNEAAIGSYTMPSVDTYQLHGAERILVLPRGGKNTFVVGMGSS